MNEEEKKALAKQLILKLLNGPSTDSENNKIAEELRRLVPDPDLTKYIFWSDEFYDDNEILDVDAVLEKAFSYKPIAL